MSAFQAQLSHVGADHNGCIILCGRLLSQASHHVTEPGETPEPKLSQAPRLAACLQQCLLRQWQQDSILQLWLQVERWGACHKRRGYHVLQGAGALAMVPSRKTAMSQECTAAKLPHDVEV